MCEFWSVYVYMCGSDNGREDWASRALTRGAFRRRQASMQPCTLAGAV